MVPNLAENIDVGITDDGRFLFIQLRKNNNMLGIEQKMAGYFTLEMVDGVLGQILEAKQILINKQKELANGR